VGRSASTHFAKSLWHPVCSRKRIAQFSSNVLDMFCDPSGERLLITNVPRLKEMLNVFIPCRVDRIETVAISDTINMLHTTRLNGLSSVWGGDLCGLTERKTAGPISPTDLTRLSQNCCGRRQILELERTINRLQAKLTASEAEVRHSAFVV